MVGSRGAPSSGADADRAAAGELLGETARVARRRGVVRRCGGRARRDFVPRRVCCGAKKGSANAKKGLSSRSAAWDTVEPGPSTDVDRTSPITIKKYANRRLYNTASSSYVTLGDLAKMVKVGEEVVVYDAKTNEDITREVLAQIMFEQEGVEGQALLPIAFLRQLIRCYGDGVQTLLPAISNARSTNSPAKKQAMREAASRAFGPGPSSPGSVRRGQGADAQEPRGVQPGAGAVFAVRQRRRQARRRRPRGGGRAAVPPARRRPRRWPTPTSEELRLQIAEMRRRLDSLTEKR